MSMFDLTYRYRNRLLLVAVIVCSYLSYSLAFSETFKANRNCRSLKDQLSVAANAPGMINDLKKKLMILENEVSSDLDKTTDHREALMGIISSYCQNNGLILREVPRTIETSENDLLVETNMFTVEGNFRKILDIIYQIECVNKVSKVASVKFHSKEDSKSKKRILYGVIYLQNVNKK